MSRTDVPVEPLDYTYWTYMTPDEWKLVYVLSAALEAEGTLAAEELGCFSLDFLFRSTIRGLEGNGVEFKGIRTDRDSGRLFLKQEEPLSEGNVNWLYLWMHGTAADYENHLPEAIRYAEHIGVPAQIISLMKKFQMDVWEARTIARESLRSQPKEVQENLVERAKALDQRRLEAIRALERLQEVEN